MEEGETMRLRSTSARIGIAALNLLTPGLGLLRLGRLRPGIVFALSSLALIGILTLAAKVLPTLTPGFCLVLFVLTIPVGLFFLVVPMIMGWRPSRYRSEHRSWCSKWYALTAFALIVQVATSYGIEFLHSFYRPFYIPSEAMRPTLEVGDRLVADMRVKTLPKRGDVILMAVGSSLYIKRVVGLPGDTVEMREGIPIVNGQAASQRPVGKRTVLELGETYVATILAERLPGTNEDHLVLDMGHSRTDEMAAARVPAGHLFVLGDSRDRSADSRVSRAEGGVEMLPVVDLRGRALFRTWTTDGSVRWLGTPVR